MRNFSIAILGFGTVGTGVFNIIKKTGKSIEVWERMHLSVGKILVRDIPRAEQRFPEAAGLYTTSFDEILADPNIDVVVECIGGIEPARTYILKALQAGKTVVTANKEVVAKHWPVFNTAARESGAGFYMEATVAGGIPIIRTVNDSMQANDIVKVMGIINGTTNYILTNMADNGSSFHDVLKEAQELGYAEADPTADVEAYDAMYKLSILSSLSFGIHIPLANIHREGITGLTEQDFEAARLLGYEIKLLAIAKKTERGVEARVHPTMLRKDHPLASVRGVFNAVFLTGDAVGDVMLYGRGAGSLPTASAVLSDVIFACQHMDNPTYPNFQIRDDLIEGVTMVENYESIYCIRLNVEDQPGSLAKTAEVFANHNVSLKDVIQLGERAGGSSHITFMTHLARENDVNEALAEIKQLPCTIRIESLIRAEGE